MSPNLKVLVDPNFGIIKLAYPYKDEPQQGSGHSKPNTMFCEAVPRARALAGPLGEPINDAGGGNEPRPVGTVARITYELDSFPMNDMLIIYNKDDPTSVSTAKRARRTFEGFRFVVHMHSNATRARDTAVLQEFFKQDFNQYGCVGVVVVSQTPKEEDVLRYFHHEFNQTLNGKPKIFISEQEENNSALNVNLRVAHELFRKRGRDVFHLRLQNSLHTFVRKLNKETPHNPLSLLCEKIDELADNKHLVDIVNIAGASIHNAVIDSDVRNARETYTIASSLNKELWLWKT